MAKTYDYLFTLLLIGDSGSGKTEVLFRFADDAFNTTFISTIGVDFKIKEIELDGKKIKLQIWDTAVQERFRTITTAYYRVAEGIMLLYDITNDKTFENMKNWIRNIGEHASQDVVKILVGNKCDMENERVVSKERGAQLATEYGMKFLEISAKENINVELAFYTLARDIKLQMDKKFVCLTFQEQLKLDAASSHWIVKRRKQTKGFFSSARDFLLGKKSEPSSDDTLLKQLKESGIKVKDLPHEVIYKLANSLKLQRDNTWKQLAELIGFSNDFIQHLEEYPTEVTQRLLIQWGESEPDSTVFELYSMLKQLGRDDATEPLLRLPQTINSRTVPPEILARGPLAFEAYNNALREGRTRVKRVPVMLIGQDRSGKTSLKKSLRGELFNPDEDSTVGIDKDPSHFKVTTEIWKPGEKGEPTNADSAISYEHHAAQLIVSSLTGKKPTPAEDSPQTMPSVSTSLSSEDASASNETRDPEKKALKRVQTEGRPITNTDSAPSREFPSTSAEAPNANFHDSKTSNAPEGDVSSPNDEPKVPDEIAAQVEKLLLEVNKVEEECIHSVLWDFGGQSVYYVTHPLFLTPRAMYLLVYDLSRNPYGKATSLVRQGMFKEFEDHFSLKTNLDYLDSWMTSIASLASQDEDHQVHVSSDPKPEVLPDKLPPVFLVCTHADKPLGGADPCTLAREIFDILQRKSYSGQLVERVFVVNNTLSGSKSECSEVIRLRQDILAIAKELPQMKEVIPIKWLKYEKALQVIAEEEGHKCISLERAKKIASEGCKIYGDQEFLTLLNFFHDQRILIHFDDTPVLNNLVVLDPQWLINVFKKVITVKPYDHQEREFKDLWRKLETTGILEETLLKHVWGPLLDQQETSESLIAIMEKFSLLCPWPSSDASCSKQYLVPSMLMSHPTQDIVMLVASAPIPSLFLKFESGQIPPSFFPRLVLQFFQWCTEEFSNQTTPQLFHNFARFYICSDTGCSVVLLCHLSSVEVIFLGGNRNVCVADSLQSEVNRCAEFPHDTFDVTSACVVRNQLALLIDSMRSEFCWLRNMRCEVSFLCPVCSHGGTVDYCRNHHAQGCKQEECLHFFSESELLKSKQAIICTRSATAQENRVQIKQFSPWFALDYGKQQQQAASEDCSRLLPFVHTVEIQQHQENSLALPCDVLQTLYLFCDPQDVVVQLQEHLQLNQVSLSEPGPETTKWIRCLATEANRSDRLDVVRYLREITPAGTTGPLLNEHLHIREIPRHQRTDLAVHLCGGEEWKLVADRLGFNDAYIRCFDYRFRNPFETVLSCCNLTVGQLYDVLVECGFPVFADFL